MTLNGWNPNATGIEGLEHIDAGYHQQALVDADSDAFGLRFKAKAGSTLPAVDIYTGTGTASDSELGSRFGNLQRPMFLELVDRADEASGTVVQDLIAPSALTASAGMYSESLGSPTLADITSADDGNYLVASTLNAFIDVSFDTATFPLDRQILRVGFRVDTNATWRLVKLDGSDYSWYKDIPGLAPSPMPFYPYVSDVKWDYGDTAWSWWTPQDIRDMRVGGGRRWRFQCRAGPGVWKLDFIRMAVIWVPERRVGVGIGMPNTQATWTRFDMSTPAGTGDPALSNGADYTLIARRATPYSQDTTVSNAILPWRALNGDTLVGSDTWTLHRFNRTVPPDVATAPIMLSGPLKAGGVRADVAGIAACRMVTGSGFRPETQPYELMRGALVYDTHQVDQTIVTTNGAVTYGQVIAMVGRKNLLGKGTLRVEVLNSTGDRVLGVATRSIAEWADTAWDSAGHSVTDDIGVTYKRMRFQFDSFSTLTPGTYTLRFSAPDSSDTYPWYIGALISSVTAGSNHTFGGSTEAAEGHWPSGSDHRELTDATWSSDAMAVLATVPPPVTGVGVAVGVVTAHSSDLDPSHNCFRSGCVNQGAPFAQLTWDIAPDTEATYYQVQRKDIKDLTWQNVTQVAGRTTLAWDDHEIRMGVETAYRLRSVRPDGVAGEWSAEVTTTAPRNVALAFTSNAATGMGCTYFEGWESNEIERSFTHLEFGDVEYRSLYGRNGQVSFRPAERKGVRFERNLLLSAMRAVALPTLDVSDALRNLAWAPLPYVCVRDGEGNRWFATLEVPTTTNVRTEGSERWYAEVAITVASTRPYNYDTGVVQVTPEVVGVA